MGDGASAMGRKGAEGVPEMGWMFISSFLLDI
jgi:hypothetical protein